MYLAYTNTCSYSHSDAGAQSNFYAHSDTVANTFSNSCARSDTVANAFSNFYAHSDTVANTFSNSCARSDTVANAFSNFYAHSDTVANTHCRSDVYSNRHTCTCSYTVANANSSILCSICLRPCRWRVCVDSHVCHSSGVCAIPRLGGIGVGDRRRPK